MPPGNWPPSVSAISAAITTQIALISDPSAASPSSQRSGRGMKPLVRRTYLAYAAPLDRALCFSSSRLPVRLTEPHHGIAEVVRVPGVAPQPAVEHPPGVGRVGPEPAQLRVPGHAGTGRQQVAVR